MLTMKRRVSTRSPDIGVVDMLVDMAAGAARAQSGLRDSGYASRFKRPSLSERRDKARVASYLACASAAIGVHVPTARWRRSRNGLSSWRRRCRPRMRSWPMAEHVALKKLGEL